MTHADIEKIEALLRADESLNEDQRSDLWDAYTQSGSHSELADKLKTMHLTPQMHNALVIAKANDVPVVHQVISTMQALGTENLELAERYPTVFRELVKLHTKGAPASETQPEEASHV